MLTYLLSRLTFPPTSRRLGYYVFFFHFFLVYSILKLLRFIRFVSSHFFFCLPECNILEGSTGLNSGFPGTYLARQRCSIFIYWVKEYNERWNVSHIDKISWLVHVIFNDLLKKLMFHIRKKKNAEWLNSFFKDKELEYLLTLFSLLLLSTCFYKIISYLMAEVVLIVSDFSWCRAQWTDAISSIHIFIFKLNCPEFDAYM